MINLSEYRLDLDLLEVDYFTEFSQLLLAFHIQNRSRSSSDFTLSLD